MTAKNMTPSRVIIIFAIVALIGGVYTVKIENARWDEWLVIIDRYAAKIDDMDDAITETGRTIIAGAEVDSPDVIIRVATLDELLDRADQLGTELVFKSDWSAATREHVYGYIASRYWVIGSLDGEAATMGFVLHTDFKEDST